MSGGSFNYLYLRDAGDLTPAADYSAMADYCQEQGWLISAAKLRELATMARAVEAKHRELSALMHDVEWCASGDIVPGDFRHERQCTGSYAKCEGCQQSPCLYYRS